MTSATSSLQTNGISLDDAKDIKNVIKVKSEGDQSALQNHFLKLRVVGSSSSSLNSLNDIEKQSRHDNDDATSIIVETKQNSKLEQCCEVKKFESNDENVSDKQKEPEICTSFKINEGLKTESEKLQDTDKTQPKQCEDVESEALSNDINAEANFKNSFSPKDSNNEQGSESEEQGDVNDLNSVSQKVNKISRGQRRGSRNLSIGSFRRMFKKRHQRSFSESPVAEKKSESDDGENDLRKTHSETRDIPVSPVSTGEDEVFGQGEQSQLHKNLNRAHSDTEAPPRPKSKLKHTHTLPSFFSYTRRASVSKEAKSSEDDEAKDSSQIKRKFGSFGFSRQLPDCKEDKDESGNTQKGKSKDFDTVYKVLKEGIDLRYKELSPGSEENSINNESKSFFPRKNNQRKTPKLKHQLSEPTPECSTSFQEICRAARSEDTICNVAPEKEFLPFLSDHQAKTETEFRTVQPTLDVNQNNAPEETDNALSNMSKQQLKEIERLTEEGSMYVALYKYKAREKDDLSLSIGDRVHVIDDSNNIWWMGECDNKTGFIPCNYVMQLRPKEKIYVCSQATLLQDFSKKEVQLKKNQVVAVSFSRPVKDSHYVLTRCPHTEGYVHKENLHPL